MVSPYTNAYLDRLLNIGVSHKWDDEFGQYFAGITKAYPRNEDLNSGDPIGIGVPQYTANEGHRVTASRAFLSNPPTKLTVMTDTLVERIIIEDGRAVGVQVASNSQSGERSITPDLFCFIHKS